MNQKVRVTLLVFAFACLVVPIAEAEGPNDRDGFSVRDIAGPMAFAFDGVVTVDTVAAPAAAVGRFIADGHGQLTDGVRTLVVGGTVLQQTFTCTYTVDPNGTGTATCFVITGPVSSDESFDFVIVEKRKKAYFTATTPGVTIRGLATRQQ
jgi:hypothetical protein